MTDNIEFELVTPEKIIKSESVEMGVIPGSEGDLGVLPNHTPLIATLRPGILKIYENGEIKQIMFVGGGFCEILPERCVVLADEAMAENEITHAKAESRLASAKATLEKTIAHAENFREVTEAQKTLAVAKELLATASIIEKGD